MKIGELVRGDAAMPIYERYGWACNATRSALFTIYRAGTHAHAMSADVVAELLAAPPGNSRPGGWCKSVAGHHDADATITAATHDANESWFRYPLTGLEPSCVHRYPTGSCFAPHVDRTPMFTARALNIVVMLQPARRGGRLLFHLGGEPIDPDLQVGDVCVYDGLILHEVTEIEAGERVTFVSHALRAHPVIGT